VKRKQDPHPTLETIPPYRTRKQYPHPTQGDPTQPGLNYFFGFFLAVLKF